MARVSVKPYVTYRAPTPGVTTSPAFIEAVMARRADWTGRIAVGEGDVFVTLPVPRVHAMAGGPGTMRLRNHPDFVPRTLTMDGLVKPHLGLFGGTYW